MFAPKIAKAKAKATSATAPTHAPKTGHHIPGQRAGSVAEWASLLQRTIGNQATTRLLAQRSSRPSGTEPGVQHTQGADLARIAGAKAAPGAIQIQTKL